jgi:hypothetical protein
MVSIIMDLIVENIENVAPVLSAITESSKSFRTILRQVDTDSSFCCLTAKREIIGVRLPFDIGQSQYFPLYEP